MVLGIFLFAANDTLGKWLVATYSVGQILLIRSIAALVVLLPFTWREGVAGIRAMPNPRLQIARVVLSTIEVSCFYWAVVYLPLADVMTYYLAPPIYVAALAVPLLGERLDRRRALAVAAGFVGVLVALKPTPSSLSWPALIPVVGSLCFAFMMIATRKLRGTSAGTLVLTQTLAALLFGLVAAPFAWTSPSLPDLGLLALLGVVSLLGHVCVNQSLRVAPASIVVPYQYTLIVWAALFGYVVFGDVVEWTTMVGAGIIILAGLALILFERGDAKRAIAAPTPAKP